MLILGAVSYIWPSIQSSDPSNQAEAVFAGCLASVVATGLILLLEEKPLEAPEVDKRRMSMDPTVPLQVAPASCIPEIKQAETLIVH